MTEALWTSQALLDAVEGRVVGVLPGAITGIAIDSRTIRPGEAFFAIKGDRFDGHAFAQAALDHGASLAIVAEDRLAELDGFSGPAIVVPDVLDALRRLGRAARRRTGARVAAITGSVGKTGTKEALSRALARCGDVHASVASFNNHWGVPLTLARMPADSDYGVFEIGMNHAGEITPLTAMVRPHVAVVTTVEAVHIEFFPSVAAIAEAKAEIFIGLEPGGTAIVNRDNRYCDLLIDRAQTAGAARVITFGHRGDADVRLIDTEETAAESTVTADLMGRQLRYRIGAPGRHWVLNSLSVVAALDALGADVTAALPAFAEISPPRGRGETHTLTLPNGRITLIDESYNANPASMRAALSVLAATAPDGGGRRIAVLGDMLELGATARDEHTALAEPVVDAGVDQVFAAGAMMRHFADALAGDIPTVHALESNALVAPLSEVLRDGDVVMIKGSLGSRMGPIVEALKALAGTAAPE